MNAKILLMTLVFTLISSCTSKSSGTSSIDGSKEFSESLSRMLLAGLCLNGYQQDLLSVNIENIESDSKVEILVDGKSPQKECFLISEESHCVLQGKETDGVFNFLVSYKSPGQERSAIQIKINDETVIDEEAYIDWTVADDKDNETSCLVVQTAALYYDLAE